MKARPWVVCSDAQPELDSQGTSPRRAKLCRATRTTPRKSVCSGRVVPLVPGREVASAAHLDFAVSSVGRNRDRTSGGRHFHACRRRRSQDRQGTSKARSSQVLRERSCLVLNAVAAVFRLNVDRPATFDRFRCGARIEILRPKTGLPQCRESCPLCRSSPKPTSPDRPLQTQSAPSAKPRSPHQGHQTTARHPSPRPTRCHTQALRFPTIHKAPRASQSPASTASPHATVERCPGDTGCSSPSWQTGKHRRCTKVLPTDNHRESPDPPLLQECTARCRPTNRRLLCRCRFRTRSPRRIGSIRRAKAEDAQLRPSRWAAFPSPQNPSTVAFAPEQVSLRRAHTRSGMHSKPFVACSLSSRYAPLVLRATRAQIRRMGLPITGFINPMTHNPTHPRPVVNPIRLPRSAPNTPRIEHSQQKPPL